MISCDKKNTGDHRLLYFRKFIHFQLPFQKFNDCDVVGSPSFQTWPPNFNEEENFKIYGLSIKRYAGCAFAFFAPWFKFSDEYDWKIVQTFKTTAWLFLGCRRRFFSMYLFHAMRQRSISLDSVDLQVNYKELFADIRDFFSHFLTKTVLYKGYYFISASKQNGEQSRTNFEKFRTQQSWDLKRTFCMAFIWNGTINWRKSKYFDDCVEKPNLLKPASTRKQA